MKINKRNPHLRKFFDLLSKKEEEAIEFIKKHEPEEGYFLGDSGGKDSSVLLHLATRANVKFYPYYNITTIDPPELVVFIKKFHKDTKFLRPKRNFYELIMYNKMLPTKMRRWCCSDLKKIIKKINYRID